MYNTSQPFFSKNDINELLPQIKTILEGGGFLAKGPKVKEFERLFSQYLGVKYGLAVNSGTSALEIVLKAIGIAHGDEVIVPTQTFVSTASSVSNNKGRPIFCQIDNNHLIDFEDLKSKITNKTKAVIIVHFGGLIHPQIFEIKKYLKNRKIYLIEDAAHAHGATIDNIYAGNIGDFGCFSFFSTKIITTGGEGGFISTNNKSFFELCSSLSAIGIDKKSDKELYINSGSNNRLTEIQSVIGINQLSNLENFIKHRILISEIYKNELDELNDNIISFQKYPKNIRHPFWLFIISVEDENKKRSAIKRKLKKDNININWPYEPLLHKQPVFRELNQTGLAKSEELSKKHLCLPIHMGITEEDAKYIAKSFNKALSCE